MEEGKADESASTSVLPGQLNTGSGGSGGDDPATPLMKGKDQRLADELSTAERYDKYKKSAKADVDMHQVASASKAVQQA